MRPFIKQGLKLVPLILIPIIYISYSHFLKPDEVLKRLEAEFDLIELPENTALLNFNKYFKPTNALFTANYSTEKGRAALLSHYETVLTDHDWVFCCRSDGKDGEKLLFQKEEFIAYLYTPVSANEKFEFRFSMSWGLGGCESDCNTKEPNKRLE